MTASFVKSKMDVLDKFFKVTERIIR